MTMSSDEQRLWRLEQWQRAQWDLQWGLTDHLIKARRELALDVAKMSMTSSRLPAGASTRWPAPSRYSTSALHAWPAS
jgi:hypothetical protein